VLGIDLASKRWDDVGVALVEGAPDGSFASVEVRLLSPGPVPLTAAALAAGIDRLAREHDVAAVSLDGPQGWRDPHTTRTRGVGRASDAMARTQGKAGTYGKAYPGTQLGWFELSIDVFDRLLGLPHVGLANDATAPTPRPERGYIVMECFPTLTWRSLGLTPLPGKSSSTAATVSTFASRLAKRTGLPIPSGLTHHDDLQAIVATLPAFASFATPPRARALGEAARRAPVSGAIPAHWIEGFIWDVAPAGRPDTAEEPVEVADADNPLVPDDRTEVGDEALARGVALFEELVALANRGQPTGIDYAWFVATINGRPFEEVRGRSFTPGDAGATVALAQRVTAGAGGRKTVRRGSVAIEAGMDSFVWSQKAERSEKAFDGRHGQLPYSRREWLAVFPDGERVVRTRAGDRRHRAP
jgi:hypothetical protein